MNLPRPRNNGTYPLFPSLYAATGFLLTRREVYEAIREKCKLPICNEQWGKPTVPYFMPMVVEEETPSPRPSPVKGEGDTAGQLTHHSPTHHSPTHQSPPSKRYAYLGDDFAFCYRARQAGYKIYADTTIRLGHIGPYAFSWEEAGGSNQRFGTYIYRVLDAESGDGSAEKK
jgi:hypothetical protein